MFRFKSIDTFRGICMAWMFLGHLLEWWIKPEYLFINTMTHQILDSMGASGFLFISGLSITLSLRKKQSGVEYDSIETKREYFLKALFLLIIALLYNLPIAIYFNNFASIWMWFVLLTAAISLILAWPLLRLPISIRLIIGFSMWVINYYVFNYLSSFKGEFSIYGALYHLLYNEPQMDPILNFFPFFLFGTVIGELIFRLNLNKQNLGYKKTFKQQLTIPLSIISIAFITFGVLFDYPKFLLERGSISWNFYSLGIEVLLLVIFLSIEFLFEFNTERSHRFLFYFSYYSFTVYLTHHLLYFLFLEQLDYITIWLAIAITFVLIGLILRTVYKYLGPKASIKVLISKLSAYLASKR